MGVRSLHALLSASYLIVGAERQHTSGVNTRGAVNEDVTNITLQQTLYFNTSMLLTYFGASFAISSDESKIAVGAPLFALDGGNQTGAVVVFSYNLSAYVLLDMIATLDVQASYFLGYKR